MGLLDDVGRTFSTDNIVRTASEAAPVIGTAAGAYLGGWAGAGLGMMAGTAFQQRYDQRAANEQSIGLSREQMDFQERMSSTAHQREVEDLKKAGLNPILSANAGASAPSGALANIKSVGEASGATAAQVASQIIGLKNLEANTDSMKASAALSAAQTSKTLIDAKVAEKDLPRAEITSGIWNWIKGLWQKQQPSPQMKQRGRDNWKKLNDGFKINQP